MRIYQGQSRIGLVALGALIGTFTGSFAAHSQGDASADWTPQERQFVDDMRAVYQKQGLDMTPEQAQSAVARFRDQHPTVQRGVPESEWTPGEVKIIAQARKEFQKQGLPFTDEQARITVQTMRDRIAKMTGQVAVMQAMTANNGAMMKAMGGPEGTQLMPPSGSPAAAPAGAPTGTLASEEQIAAQIARFPSKTGGVSIRQRREGFTVNDQPVVDPEGRISMYGFDVITGDITFAVDTPSGTVIKFMRAGVSMPPVRIATAVRGNAGWSVQTAGGQAISGPTLSMMPKGILVSRAGAAFRYDPGQGIKSIAVPDGYVMAPIQRGNIGGTGFMLLEKEDATGGGNSTAQMLSSFKALGNQLGLNAKADFALFNGDTGKIIPLNIDADGQTITALSDCYQRSQNSVVSRCYSAQSFESLYSMNGSRNIQHYYWRAQWLNTPQGPIAVTMEDANKEIFITDLTSGKKVVAFHRVLGIADMDVNQDPNGTVSIKAQLAFSHESVDDAVAFLANAASGTVAVAKP
jgi:hypothetical protein